MRLRKMDYLFLMVVGLALLMAVPAMEGSLSSADDYDTVVFGVF